MLSRVGDETVVVVPREADGQWSIQVAVSKSGGPDDEALCVSHGHSIPCDFRSNPENGPLAPSVTPVVTFRPLDKVRRDWLMLR